MKFPEKISLPWYTGAVLVLALCIYLYGQSVDHRKQMNSYRPGHRISLMLEGKEGSSNIDDRRQRPKIQKRVPHSPQSLPDGVGRMAQHPAAWYGGQITADELRSLLTSYAISYVIDFAKSPKAEATLTNEKEAAICRSYNAQYYYFNIEAKHDRLNQQVLQFVDSLLLTGESVFIHSRRGKRALVPVARYYAQAGHRWEDVMQMSGLQAYINNPQNDRYTNDVWEHVQRFNHPVNYSK